MFRRRLFEKYLSGEFQKLQKANSISKPRFRKLHVQIDSLMSYQDKMEAQNFP